MPLILFKSDSSPWQVSWTETLFAFSQHWVPFGILSLYSSLNALEIDPTYHRVAFSEIGATYSKDGRHCEAFPIPDAV